MLNNLERRASKLLFSSGQISFNSETFLAAREFGFVLGLTVLGMLLSLQGWKALIPAFDMLTYFDNAYNLIHHGILPVYGDISSYGSFSPPGTTWLIALGMLVIQDPRLYEKAGSALLHFGTLWGIFILTKKFFGAKPAYFAALLYGLSSIGLDYSGSLWPIGHPFFYVWMTYFALLWAQYQNAKYLTLAGITWAIGMNVDMAIAPLILILPAIWVLCHPPIISKSLFLGVVVCFLIWYPYLKFEAKRDFVDLRSQIGRQNIFPVNYRTSWCDPNHQLAQSENPSRSIPMTDEKKAPQTIVSRWPGYLHSAESRLAQGFLSNFNESTSVPGGNLILLSMGLGTLLFVGVGNPFISEQGKNVASTQSIFERMYRWGKNLIAAQDPKDQFDGRKLMAISLLIPWLILVMVAEAGRTERFLWLWVLQLLVVSVFATYVLPSFKFPKILVYLSQLLLIILILPFSSLPTRFANWSKNGWAGQDAGEKQVVDYLAGQLKAEAKNRASIGYQTFIYPFMANYNIINSRYKVGAEFDLLFKYQHGILNTTQCAEGFSSQDEYRILETAPKYPAWAPRDHFNLPPDGRYKPIGQFGSYVVFKRE